MGLSTVDILYAEKKKRKDRKLNIGDFMFLFFSKQKELQTFLLFFDTANFVFPREFTVKPSLYY